MLEYNLEKLIFFRVALKKTPAKGIDKEEDDPLIPGRQIPKYVERKRALSFTREQEFDSLRDIGEAIAIIKRLNGLLRECGTAYRIERGCIEHVTIFSTSRCRGVSYLLCFNRLMLV